MTLFPSPRRSTDVPDEVTVHWDDLRRGRTSFRLRVGQHVSPETFLEFNDRGVLWATVEHWIGSGPPDEDVPFPPRWSFNYVGSTFAEFSPTDSDWFWTDVVWPDLAEQAAGVPVRWPGFDVTPVDPFA